MMSPEAVAGFSRAENGTRAVWKRREPQCKVPERGKWEPLRRMVTPLYENMRAEG